MDLMTETVTLRFRGAPTGAVDRYGNAVIGPPRDESWAAWYEPRSSPNEEVHGFWLYLPLTANLSDADDVIIAGATYEVMGEPGRHPGGFLVDGFIKAAVEKVTDE